MESGDKKKGGDVPKEDIAGELPPIEEIFTRLMKEKDIDEVLHFARNKYIFVPKELVVRLYQKGHLKVILSVLVEGTIVGTCWVTNHPESTSLLSGLEWHKDDCLDAHLSLQNLYENGLKYVTGKNIYLNVTDFNKNLVDYRIYIDYFYIHLFRCRLSRVRIPESEVDEKYTLEKAPLRGPEEEISYKLKSNGEYVGLGSLVRVDSNEWLIAPLDAHTNNEVKYLLKQLLLHVMIKKSNCNLSIYIVANHERDEIMKGFGFVQQKSWHRYSVVDTPLSGEPFALGSILFTTM